MTLIHGVDYSVVNPDNKWKILKSQSRFALWALLISSGVVMQGFDIVAGGQLAALPAFKEKFGVLQPDGSHLIPCYDPGRSTGYERETAELGTEQTDPGGSGVWSNWSNESAFDHDRPSKSE